MNYEERKEARIERFKSLAQKARENSNSSYERSNKLASVIPMGQPILVGHHSEGAHRAHIKRIHSAMDKFVEESDKAEYYEQRAESAENNLAISSDDDDAIKKLEEKVIKLEGQRTQIKEHNKKARKEGTDQYPSYHLSNLGQNIRSVKQRIKQLQKVKQIEEVEETYGEITLKVDKEANRVKLFFPEKPSDEVRTKLKSNGFRWSPYNGCWQSFLKEWNIRTAREIAQEVA